MSEMVERVARALFKATYGDERAGSTFRNDLDPEDFYKDARAAIAAMREPTQAMADAGDDVGTVFEEPQTKQMWRAMIDAALL